MATKNSWTKYIVLLVIALLLLGVNFMKNRKHVQKNEQIFEFSSGDVTEISIAKDTTLVILAKSDTNWVFASQDTGEVNQVKIDNFLKNIVEEGEYSGFQTQNPDKYAQYEITEDLATKITLKLADNNNIVLYTSRSKANWAHDYIRYENNPKVYVTAKKIMYHFSENAGYWRK